MTYTVATYFLACLVDLTTAKQMSDNEKDSEIALLRLQLRIVWTRFQSSELKEEWG